MRVLVTGSRQLLDQELVYRELNLLYAMWVTERYNDGLDPEFTVVHGNAPGADTLANQWTFDHRLDLGVVVEVHPAQWNRYGRRMAGPIRNMEMIQLGADYVIGFFQPGAQNVGTRHCITEAHRWMDHKGVPIKEVWAE